MSGDHGIENCLLDPPDGLLILDKNQKDVFFHLSNRDLASIPRQEVIENARREFSDFQKMLENLPGESRSRFLRGKWPVKKERRIIFDSLANPVWLNTTYIPIYEADQEEVAYVLGLLHVGPLAPLYQEKKSVSRHGGSALQKEFGAGFDFSGIVWRSSQMRTVLKLVARVARQNTTVMLLGESGTGKELLAKAIHNNSGRADQPFVVLNCSAFPDTLIESELFGYEKGAFTGAETSKPGKLKLASGGTLFLDEVTEMSAPAQAKMLRAIQEREFQPLGGVRTVRVDVRIVAATNKDIKKLVQEGKFREDLFYRLFVFPIVVPPLRDRREDLQALIDHFIQSFNRQMGKQVMGVSPRVREHLLNYSWPGNVRELQNVLEQMMILCKDSLIDVTQLPSYMRQDSPDQPMRWSGPESLPPGFTLESYVQRFEAGVILQAMRNCGYNKRCAAAHLGLPDSTLRYKLSRMRNSYKNFFCEKFLTDTCMACQKSSDRGRGCLLLIDGLIHLGVPLSNSSVN